MGVRAPEPGCMGQMFDTCTSNTSMHKINNVNNWREDVKWMLVLQACTHNCTHSTLSHTLSRTLTHTHAVTHTVTHTHTHTLSHTHCHTHVYTVTRTHTHTHTCLLGSSSSKDVGALTLARTATGLADFDFPNIVMSMFREPIRDRAL